MMTRGSAFHTSSRWIAAVSASIVCFCVIGLTPEPCHAVSLGVYTSVGYSWVKYTYSPFTIFGEDYKETTKLEQATTGIGLMVDSNAAQRSVFNYRLSIGFGCGWVNKHWETTQSTASEKTSNTNYAVFHLSMLNSFGFGLVRTPFVRLWFGPQLGVGLIDFDHNYYFTFGAVLGANFHVSDSVSITTELGSHYMLYLGRSVGDLLLESTTTGYDVYTSVGVLFRFDDNY